MYSLYGCGVNRPCARSFCGCWDRVSYEYKTTIIDEDDVPQDDIVLYCPELDKELGKTNHEGKVTIKFVTKASPGCGIGNCRTIHLQFADTVLGKIDLGLTKNHQGNIVISTSINRHRPNTAASDD